VSRFIDEADRYQGALLPGTIDEYVSEENPVRAVDAFVGVLNMTSLGFQGAEPKATGRPGYHPATMLKIYLYGYLNRIQSSRRLEQEARRNLELMWLVGRLAPDFKTIADFRRDNGTAIRKSASNSCGCAAKLGYSNKHSLPSTAASSKRSTTATRTSHPAS
jgi:transposase